VSYSRASCSGEMSRTHWTSLFVSPAIAETTTATSWPRSHSRFTRLATLRIRSRSATEVPPNLRTSRAMRAPRPSQVQDARQSCRADMAN